MEPKPDAMPDPPTLPARVDVAVLGAGPAGLMAAIEAAAPPLTVAVLERRPFAGGQVPVAGGGRCNVTNAGAIEMLMLGFGRDGRWLEPAFRNFDNAAVVKWFEKRGVGMKEEEEGKMFPVSDDGADVQNALIREANNKGALVALRTRIEKIEVVDGELRAIVANGARVECGSLIIAAGGSGPKPTPTSGVALAALLGHAVVPPAPALAPIKLAGKPYESLAGVSLPLRLSAGEPGFVPKKARVAKTGILLFTHFGLSGPVVLDLSHPLARLAGRGPAELSLDVMPEIADARAEIERWRRESGARAVRNVNLPGVPKRVFELLLSLAGVDPERRCAELRQNEIDSLAKILKDWRIPQFEVTWAGAMVSGGGVALTEVDPKTMASRRVRGLFFAGETLDIQGECGGYNLQSSFSTGALAGQNAAAHARLLLRSAKS
jgi:hypothetical protein